jgi:hypothetical protein
MPVSRRSAAVDIRTMLVFCEQRLPRPEIVRRTHLSRAYVGRLVTGERGTRPGHDVVTAVQRLYDDVVSGRVLPIGNK